MSPSQKAVLKKLFSFIMYGTGSKEEYMLNRKGANRLNHTSVLINYSVAVVATVLLLLFGRNIFSTDVDWYYRNSSAYTLCMALSMGVLTINILFGKSFDRLTIFSAYILMMIAYTSALLISWNNEYQVVTVLLAVIPLTAVMFILPPLGLLITIVLENVAAYIVLGTRYSEEMLKWNNKNIVLVSIITYIVAFSVIILKQAKITSDRKLSEMLEKDVMTGLFNRRSFEEAIAKIKSPDEDVSLCVLDVNSLKHVNDSIGHDAGDEMIIAAADIISAVFDDYGNCYRTGGDEFVVILEKAADIATLGALLDEGMKSWHGKYAEKVSVSYGFASAADFPGCTIEELLRYADKNMYDFKTVYYAKNENERRH